MMNGYATVETARSDVVGDTHQLPKRAREPSSDGARCGPEHGARSTEPEHQAQDAAGLTRTMSAHLDPARGACVPLDGRNHARALARGGPAALEHAVIF